MGKTLHRVCIFALTLAVLLSAGVLGFAWRLSRGPVELDFFKSRVEAAVNKSIDPLRVTIGGVSIAWRGFSHGLDQPLVLRVTNLTVEQTTGTARARVPVAEAALSARWLLAGRIRPRAITLEGARLVLIRDANGAINFDLGSIEEAGSGVDQQSGPSPLLGLLAVLGAPVETDLQEGGDRLSQLSAVSIHDATLRLDDRLLGVTWSADRADIDLTRRKHGGVDGQATLVLALGGQRATLGGKFSVPPLGQSAHVAANLSPVTPKALAAAAPILTPLAALDAPLSFDGEADLGPDLLPTHLRLIARVDAGTINAAGGAVPMRRAEVVIAGTPRQMTVESAVLEVRPTAEGPVTKLTGSGELTRQEDHVDASVHVALDRAGFADLAVLWPPEVAVNARAWILQNVQAGTAHDGKADLAMRIPNDASDVSLLKVAATLDGDDLAVAWLPTVPRIEQGKARLVMTDPDKIDVTVRSGLQRVKGADPIAVQNGHVNIIGLTVKDQVATIHCDVSGSVVSAIALLKEPRLGLLDRHPMELRAPAGDIRMNLMSVVPLEKRLRIDDVTIHATGNLSKVHLGGIAAGRDMDDGSLAFDVDTSHLTLKGTANLAGIPATIDGAMDFRAGPPSQVLQKITVTGKPSARALASAGLDAGDVLTGDVGLNMVLTEYRNGDGEVTADADLAQSGLSVAPLGWKKPSGAAAKASARVTLAKDKLTGIDRVVIDGPGIQVRGGVTVFGGKLDTVKLDRLILGQTNVSGTIRLPHDGPIGVDLAGPVLDIAAAVTAKRTPRDPAAPRGPEWSMRGRFDRVLLAHDRIATNVVVDADDDGEILRGLAITGKTGATQSFSIRIGPGPAENGRPVRRLTASAADAGALLNGLDVTDSIQGGELSITGGFNDGTRKHLLSGTFQIDDFRVTHAPALGKLLQAVTLYGLVDALGGPGVGFSLLTAPFQYDDDSLVVRDARAFSSSLGLTAQGRIDRATNTLDLNGTLVPAYVFNSLLGKIPLIGGLFSAEKGGGLFAMNYSLQGLMDNPTVVANPFSALTPGILRGMFGLFGQASPGQPPPGPVTPGGNVQHP
jgi:hypothetical protein